MLDALSWEDIPSELLELIQGWILSDDSAAEKDRALYAIMDRLFDEAGDRRPESRTYESLARLHERIDLSDPETPVEKSAPTRRPWLRVAATVIPLLVVAGALLLTLRHSLDPEPDRVVDMTEAVPDDEGRLTLADGSSVRLIGDTRITVAENFAENRSVKLSGEAFFSVAEDPTKPFTVETDLLTVTVLGTEFNLKAYPQSEKTVVSLASGQVRVTDGSGITVLAPMEQLIYDKDTGESVVAEVTAEQIDRWRFGEQRLDDISLEEALRAVADFYGKEIVIDGILPPDTGVTTILKENSTAGSALEAIRLMSDAFTYSIEEDVIYIESK